MPTDAEKAAVEWLRSIPLHRHIAVLLTLIDRLTTRRAPQADDEAWLASCRRLVKEPGDWGNLNVERLLAMLDAAHDQLAEVLPLLQDAARDVAAYDQIAEGWRQDGAAEERVRLIAWCRQQARNTTAVLPDHVDSWYCQVAMYLTDHLPPLPALQPPSAARARADVLANCLRGALSQLDARLESSGLSAGEVATRDEARRLLGVEDDTDAD